MKPSTQFHVPWKDRFAAMQLSTKWMFESSPWLTVFICTLMILGGLLAVVEPYLFKIVIDKIVGNANIPATTEISIALLGILALYGAARFIQGAFWDVTNTLKRIQGLHAERISTHKLLSAISNLDQVYFDSPEYYNTVARASNGLWRLTEVFWLITYLLNEIVSASVILVALAAYDWRLVGLVLLGAIPGMILAMKGGDRVWSAFAESSPIYRHANYYKSLISDQPDAAKELRLMNLHTYFLRTFQGLFKGFIEKQSGAEFGRMGWHVLAGIVEGAVAVVAAVLVIWQFLSGKITVGELTFLWAMSFSFSAHARWLVRMTGDIIMHATFLTPIVQVMSFKPAIINPTQPARFPTKVKDGIEFKDVYFRYPGAHKLAVAGLNLSIKPGTSIALVGENGSSKTTLIKLLCRLYDVTNGSILIDGKDIREYNARELYRNIGVIFQDFVKYEATVYDNIRYGSITKGGRRKVHDATRKSGAWEFIKDLHNKYKTHLGRRLHEEGTNLSIGQWQKIALARAFFKDAQILILDEPTSAVDAEAEYKLFQRFKRLSKGKITILISHRFSTVRMADTIIVMKKGKIVENGTHSELMQKNGHYARMFKLQAEGYKTNKTKKFP